MESKKGFEYGWGSSDVTVACKRVAAPVMSEIKKYGGHRVLDIGCGNGSLCGVLKKSGYDVVGIENDRSGVNIAKTTYPMVSFYHYGVQDDPAELLSFEREKFDIVVSTEVIEHLFIPEQLLIYAKSVLKDGGVLILTMPYYGYMKNLLIAILNKWDQHHSALVNFGHIKFFSKKTIRKLLEQSGYQVLDCYGIGRRVPFLWNTMVVVGKPK